MKGVSRVGRLVPSCHNDIIQIVQIIINARQKKNRLSSLGGQGVACFKVTFLESRNIRFCLGRTSRHMSVYLGRSLYDLLFKNSKFIFYQTIQSPGKLCCMCGWQYIVYMLQIVISHLLANSTYTLTCFVQTSL